MRRRALCSLGTLGLMGILAVAPAGAQAPQTDGAADKATVEQTFRDYLAAFSAGDPGKIVTYYNEPMMLVPSGKVLATKAELETWVRTVRGALQSRGIADYALQRLTAKLLGQDLAVASFLVQRRAKDGSVLEVVAGSYYLRRSETGWKIAVIAAYPAADHIKLD